MSSLSSDQAKGQFTAPAGGCDPAPRDALKVGPASREQLSQVVDLYLEIRGDGLGQTGHVARRRDRVNSFLERYYTIEPEGIIVAADERNVMGYIVVTKSIGFLVLRWLSVPFIVSCVAGGLQNLRRRIARRGLKATLVGLFRYSRVMRHCARRSSWTIGLAVRRNARRHKLHERLIRAGCEYLLGEGKKGLSCTTLGPARVRMALAVGFRLVHTEQIGTQAHNVLFLDLKREDDL